MSVYHKFSKNDILYSVIHTTPRIVLASGSAGPSGSIDGWRGNTGPSASLSLYEGVRSRRDVRSGDFVTSGISIFPLDPIDTHSIDKVIFVSGSYPSTGSVRMVKIRREAAPNILSYVTDVDWYEEHFSPILLLYSYYNNFRDGYFTGSYDYYSLYFKQDLAYNVRAVNYSGSSLSSLSASFTMGAFVKPTEVTGTHDFTVQSQRARWKLYVTGSTGRLAWTDFATVLTSSVALTNGVWQHVALTVSSGSASFYIDSEPVGTFAYTGSLAPFTGAYLVTSSFLTVGAEQVMSQTLGPGIGVTSSFVRYDQGFSGFIFESRIWGPAQTAAQLSGNYSHTLVGSDSGSAYLLHYSRFNDGPLGSAHGFVSGSGAFDYGRAGIHGQFQNFTVLPHKPSWQPNDNPYFVTPKTRIDKRVDMFRAIHVPSMFYGRQIATGSVQLVCNAYNNQGLVRVIQDDGRGGLYVSGSITREISGEDYRGARWNKVGNVFYTEGLIVITDPSLLDFGEDGKDWTGSPDILQVSFSGQERITTKVFMCRLGAAQGNASNNPTFSVVGDPDETGRLGPSDGDPSNDMTFVRQEGDAPTWITAVGLYNEERQLVAVAKLAQPIRKREKDRIDIRLRMDF